MCIHFPSGDQAADQAGWGLEVMKKESDMTLELDKTKQDLNKSKKSEVS